MLGALITDMRDLTVYRESDWRHTQYGSCIETGALQTLNRRPVVSIWLLFGEGSLLGAHMAAEVYAKQIKKYQTGKSN